MTSNLLTISILIKPRHLRKLEEDAWYERPVPARLIFNKKTYDITMTYRGNHTREFRKKSYHIIFNTYNEEFRAKEIHLNAEYRDPSLIRNKLSFEFFQKIGCLVPQSTHVFLFINGKAEGVYLLIESVDQYFLKERNLPLGPIFYGVNYHANFSLLTEEGDVKSSLLKGYETKEGSLEDEKDLEMFIAKINTLPREVFPEEISKVLNIRQFLLWLCGIICTQNFDGFEHNYSLYKNTETNLYEMIPWDYDATFGRDCDGVKMEYDYIGIEGFNALTARILDIKEFRQQYKTLMEKVLTHHFTPQSLEPMINTMYEDIKDYMKLDPYKSQSGVIKFEKEFDYIRQFIKDRNQYLKEQLDHLN